MIITSTVTSKYIPQVLSYGEIRSQSTYCLFQILTDAKQVIVHRLTYNPQNSCLDYVLLLHYAHFIVLLMGKHSSNSSAVNKMAAHIYPATK